MTHVVNDEMKVERKIRGESVASFGCAQMQLRSPTDFAIIADPMLNISMPFSFTRRDTL